ncbi:low molecular weight protein-tyrosine-phosphatase [Marinobacter caseinilyticus]|uniref:low molecular weight protein-tyrosine-phosphatase n=1 Tax=Marinobacter caseinilyticus TaxID=2692195 RepID=UPI00140D058D|nr:low molecular weight protein-tyrosine-phosphatase [Marinobacter caseinilyticus]
MTESTSVLFVCMGNICRSPTAEGVFRRAVEQTGLMGRIRIESCGTGGWHVGKAPDRRAVAAAKARGIDIAGLRAQQFADEDLQRFDYVLVMDRANLADLVRVWQRRGGTQPELFLTYGSAFDVEEVPDPYYGGEQGFDYVLDLIEDASKGLLNHIRSVHFEPR